MFGYAAPGDTNLDWSVDILDIADFISSGLFNAGPYNTPAGNIAAVPKPSVLWVAGVGMGFLGLWSRRRISAA